MEIGFFLAGIRATGTNALAPQLAPCDHFKVLPVGVPAARTTIRV
jgi:hypothetical protein